MTSVYLPRALTAPSAIIFIATFIVPFIYFFVISFRTVDYFDIVTTAAFANCQVMADKYWGVLLYTLWLSTVTALLTVVVGFLYAFIARFKLPKYADFMIFVVLITMFGGYLMKIYARKTILDNEGVLNTALMAAGIIDRLASALLYSPALLRSRFSILACFRCSADLCLI
jgi:spermidine/putrescine transport system permease protein